jgi:hypothetical protein
MLLKKYSDFGGGKKNSVALYQMLSKSLAICIPFYLRY